jgi:hypothetical protein
LRLLERGEMKKAFHYLLVLGWQNDDIAFKTVLIN